MGKNLTLALALAVLGALVCPLPSQAQRDFLFGPGQAVRARPHIPLRNARPGIRLTGPRGHRHSRGYRSGVVPYLYPYSYYSDYYPEPAPAEAQPDRVVVVENSKPHSEAAPPAPPPESLMLELQGNHWVRVTNSGRTMANFQPGEKGSAKNASVRLLPEQENAAVVKARELPPAVLVFRDGHKEEVTRYTIIGGTIYTRADYWNNGSWTKKVPIAELNIPATLKLNRERGANFSLPSGPHVVVIRP
jgi:hypothetical protein